MASNRFRGFRGVGTAGLLSPSLQSASAEEAHDVLVGKARKLRPKAASPPRVTPCPE